MLADDHALVRAGFDALLKACEGIRVVGQAGDGAELLSLLHRNGAPDVVVLDVSMPGMDGLRTASEIRTRFPSARILIVTMLDEPGVVKEACERGVHGFLVKDAAPQQLEHAVRVLAHGGTCFSEAATRSLLAKDPPDSREQLTHRQLEVMRLLARGLSSKEAARELGLSPKTIDVHRARIMEKLNIHEVASLTRYAIRHRLLKP
ncbi:MAG: response regulator [Burkholderiales bacterium]